MLKATRRKIYAKLFFSIFFVKILISCSPFFFDNVDKDTIIQVVLQLEIENNNGKSNGGEPVQDFLKEYSKPATHLSYLPPLELFLRAAFIFDDRRYIPAFYPSVPTPPPNI